MNCDACNKEFNSKYTAVGICISSDTTDNFNAVNVEELQKQFAPYELNKSYNVCYACWLKSLGVKP